MNELPVKLPRCPLCGTYMKPDYQRDDVVGELSPQYTLLRYICEESHTKEQWDNPIGGSYEVANGKP